VVDGAGESSARDVSPRPERRWVHYALFAATFLTTTMAGALQKGINPLTQPRGLVEGLPFSVTIMIILLGHEMGHYLTSRHHRVPATLPYFIPAPSIIGTFGAVIKMRGAIWDRRTLLDIGASGPIVGFLLALPALIAGFALSPVVVNGNGTEGLVLGDSLIVILAGFLTKGNLPESANVVLHPVGFAGWLGMFVTSLNLLPVGQLDGGHISKALFPNSSDTLAGVVHVGLFLMGFLFWKGWLIWALLLMFLGVRHPPVMLDHIQLDPKRKKLGFAAIVIFFLTFVPAPFTVL